MICGLCHDGRVSTSGHLSPGRISDGMAAAMLQENPGFVQASLSDPFEATRQTILYMCDLVKRSIEDPVVWRASAAALTSPVGGDPYSQIWYWVKRCVRFVHHQKLLQRWLNKADELQLLISPEALLRMEHPQGDCAVFTTLICGLCDCAGIPWEIVTVAVDPRQPEIFSHVYPRAVLPDGRRLPLDASHGKYPGWEVPRSRVLLLQVWSADGTAIQDMDPGYRGLHGVAMHSYDGDFWRPGLGQDDSGDFVDTGSDATPIDLGVAAPTVTYTDTSTIPTGPTYTTTLTPVASTPAGSGSTLNTLPLATQALSIFGQVVAPTTQYVRNADGSISMVTPGTATLPGVTTSLTSSSLVLFAGAALLGLLLFTSIAKK